MKRPPASAEKAPAITKAKSSWRNTLTPSVSALTRFSRIARKVSPNGEVVIFQSASRASAATAKTNKKPFCGSIRVAGMPIPKIPVASPKGDKTYGKCSRSSDQRRQQEARPKWGLEVKPRKRDSVGSQTVIGCLSERDHAAITNQEIGCHGE